jgi:hypothetical protein
MASVYNEATNPERFTLQTKPVAIASAKGWIYNRISFSSSNGNGSVLIVINIGMNKQVCPSRD